MKKTIVVKIGSLGLTSPLGGVDKSKIQALMNDISELTKLGHRIVLVASGAINAGRPYLESLKNQNEHLSFQQALAAIGQPLLMESLRICSLEHHLKQAQILVTHEDFKSRQRFLNIRNTLNLLLNQNVLPIVNENDTVSTKEISVGDNDQLAAMIAEAIAADLLILLTEADGLYDRDPKEAEAKQIPQISSLDDLSKIKIGAKTSIGRGGMLTKLEAIRKLTPLGLDVILASFKNSSPLSRAFKREGGTLFEGDQSRKISSRKAWLVTAVKPGVNISIDKGAYEALCKGKSLLPVGVKSVHGNFKRGDIICVKYQHKIIAFGISEFSSKETEIIKGLKSQEISLMIKEVHHDVLIHRDNLFLKKAS